MSKRYVLSTQDKANWIGIIMLILVFVVVFFLAIHAGW